MINHLNLVVIYSSNLEVSVSFYQNLGLTFNKEQHGNGPQHYSCEFENLIFELYPSSNGIVDVSTRIGFNVIDLEHIVESLRSNGSLIINEPTISSWGKRAVVQDPNGYKVELLESI
ncbi:VOC family protein [Bacillus niameyensis]|uniref:VOC family protein n=1 Tax=Bacillus niameyensis TaxID=1522308 RepID=UPI000780BD8C|nr:VOC family protein [Bacillus niameyensis]